MAYIVVHWATISAGRLRRDCLNQHWFASLEDAGIKVEEWRIDYNGQRPHSALRQETPRAFAAG